MPGIIFPRYDRSQTADSHEPSRTRRDGLNRRRFVGSVSALAVTASTGVLFGGRFAAAQGAPATPATPAASPSSTATTTATTSGPVEALRDLLRRIPMPSAGDSTGALFYYADLAAQFAACGIDRSSPDWTATANLFSTTAPLALVSAGFQYGLLPDFAAAFGFRPLDVDRALDAGMAPNSLSVYQGGLDRARLEAAWTTTGFKQVSLDGGYVLWTMGEEGEIDPTSPIAPYGAGAFNNLLLLDDQTLLVARKGEVIRAVAKHASSGITDVSLLAMPGMDTLLGTFSPDVVSAIGLAGAQLTSAPMPGSGRPATPAPGDSMPMISVAMFGIEAGARGQVDATGATPVAATPAVSDAKAARVEVRLQTASASDAKTAANVAASRWESMQSQVSRQPFSELMTLVSAGVAEGADTVAALDFDSGAAPGRWIQMVAMQDLAPFAPGA